MQNCLEKIERLVSQRCGISFEKKEHFFRTHLLKAMEGFEVFECQELYELLQDPKKFERFLSYVMVSQSHFFREAKQFDLLTEFINKNKKIHFKILSIPCANGEEPYSIAIYLLEKGISHFSIDAYDINPLAIHKAKYGFYCDRDLFKVPQRIKERYFEESKSGFCVKDVVKEHVAFDVCNLFELSKSGYDYIFCRNLMIYLTKEKQQEALRIFYDILNDEGYLFLSFSDYVNPVVGFDKISLENIYKKSSDEKSGGDS